jgi:hypothetical protein
VVEHYDYLRNIRVPDGVFLSSKTLNSKMDRFSYYSDETESVDHENASTSRRYEYPVARNPMSPIPSSSSTTTISPALRPISHPHLPTSSYRTPEPMPPSIFMADKAASQKVVLPPLSSLGHAGHPTHSLRSPTHDTKPTSNYTPLSSEDRRVLERLRISL